MLTLANALFWAFLCLLIGGILGFFGLVVYPYSQECDDE